MEHMGWPCALDLSGLLGRCSWSGPLAAIDVALLIQRLAPKPRQKLLFR